jgi:predicted MFS family arabinose efflux permease
MLGASLPVLAYQEYGGNPRVAGAFFAAFGAGSVIGSVAAVKLVTRFDPIRLATVALFALTLPIWALAFDIPAWAIVAALFASAIFGPLINAPMIGVITTRTPPALRAKVMTSVMTVALLAGPLALLIVGPLLATIGPRGVFAVVASGQLAAVAYFTFAVTWRNRGRATGPVPEPV